MIGKLLAHDSDGATAKHYNNNALAYLTEKREMVGLLERLLGQALHEFDDQRGSADFMPQQKSA